MNGQMFRMFQMSICKTKRIQNVANVNFRSFVQIWTKSLCSKTDICPNLDKSLCPKTDNVQKRTKSLCPKMDICPKVDKTPIFVRIGVSQMYKSIERARLQCSQCRKCRNLDTDKGLIRNLSVCPFLDSMGMRGKDKAQKPPCPCPDPMPGANEKRRRKK